MHDEKQKANAGGTEGTSQQAKPSASLGLLPVLPVPQGLQDVEKPLDTLLTSKSRLNRLDALIIHEFARKVAILTVLLHAIRMRQVIAEGRPVVFVLALALAHGLVASLLLVECIPADGRSLVELIGQDPCHHPFGAVETDSGEPHSAALKGGNDPTDPCVDLILDSVGISAGVMEIPSFSASAQAHVADASPHVGAMSPAMRTNALFKWAREPVSPGDGGFPQLLSLRI